MLRLKLPKVTDKPLLPKFAQRLVTVPNKAGTQGIHSDALGMLK